MESPKISVIIPSYNKAGYIGRTLSSIVGQNYPSLEVIVRDGGSTDGTVGIIKQFANKYPKIIKWESKKDKGQLDAINEGFKKTTGDILTFINADDVFEKPAFSLVADAYKSNPYALWFAGRSRVVDAQGVEVAKIATLYKSFLLSLNLRFWLLTTNYIMQPSVFLTRWAYEKYGPFMGTADFVTEYDLWLKFSKVQQPVVIRKTLSSFRLGPNTKTSIQFKSLLAEDDKIIRKYTSNPLILFIHAINNLLRVVLMKVLNIN